MASTALAVSPQPAARATDPAFDGDAPGAATVRAAIEAELRARDVFSTLPPVEELMEALHARLLADSADADALLPHRTLVKVRRTRGSPIDLADDQFLLCSLSTFFYVRLRVTCLASLVT